MAKKQVPTVAVGSTGQEIDRRAQFLNLMRSSPIAEDETLSNLGLFLNRQTLSRMLFMHHLYQQILPVHGVVMEFGVRWGQNLALFSSFRGIYEPFNYTRKIIGFDTFEGFPHVHAKDGKAEFIKQGAYGVGKDYEDYLTAVLEYHEHESPIPHIRKFELVKGDAVVEVKHYLERNPETVVALAFFDLDLFEPTLHCLEAIREHVCKGAILGFDEINSHSFPGETLAVKQALGIPQCRLQRVPWNPNTSYLVVGE
jgi:hypothetical protein